MKGNRAAPQNIDEYIATFPKDVRAKLEQVRTTISKAAPGATEKISYKIPTFALNGNLVHFAGWQTHIGFYPGASGIAKFKKALAGYESAKGSVQFPLTEPLPIALITKIVKFRVAENTAKSAAKRRKKA